MKYQRGGIQGNIGEEVRLEVWTPAHPAGAPAKKSGGGAQPQPAPKPKAPASAASASAQQPDPEKKADASNYWEYKGLKLAASGACEPASGSPQFQAFVKQVKDDLRAAKYLGDSSSKDGRFGGDVSGAVRRFKRAAMRPFRMLASEAPKSVTRAAGEAPDTASPLAPDDGGSGPRKEPDGTIGEKVATELHRWAEEKLVRPVGRFKVQKFRKVTGTPGLRADAADAWEEIYELVLKCGLPLQGPYGDSTRNLAMLATPGASPTSRHYCGIACDFNQHFTQLGYFNCAKNGCYENRRLPDGTPLSDEKEIRKAITPHQRYFLEAIDRTGAVIGLPQPGKGPFWRIWARSDTTEVTGLPAGVEVLKVTKEAPHAHVLLMGSPGLKVKLTNMPDGTYVDLSTLIESTGKFTRIQAHPDYLDGDGLYRGVEWWHWTFCQDGETPFSTRLPLPGGSALYASSVRLIDMAELIGFTEGDLNRAGHSAAIEKQCF